MNSIGTARSSLLLAITGACVLLAAPTAHADDTIRHPGEHFPYFLEIEPHLAFAWGDWTSGVGGGAGYGVGGRFSFTIVRNGFVPTINNSVAIGVGLDFLHFGCDEPFDGGRYSCSLNSISFPVVLQWNFYVSRQWSVFGEPGIFLYHQFFDYSGETCNGAGCPGVTATSILPALYVGGRYRFNDRMSLTMRLGYPTINIGLSFFD